MSKIWINNGIVETLISKEDIIPEGYVKGRIHRDYYTNGIKTIKLKLNESIPEGFYKGRLSFKIDEEVEKIRRLKLSNTLRNRSLEEIDLIVEKLKNTKLLRYGSFGFNNISKRRLTCLEKYSDENYSNRELFKLTVNNKSQEEREFSNLKISISLKNYIDNLSEEERKDRYNNSWGKVDRKEVAKIVRLHTIEKYGVENIALLEEVKLKMIITNLERYGVPYYCMTKKCRNSIGGNHANSGPNRRFALLLRENGIEFEQEFPLWGRLNSSM